MAIAALPLHLYLPETADVGSRSVFLTSVPILLANAGRGTTERRTRRNRT